MAKRINNMQGAFAEVKNEHKITIPNNLLENTFFEKYALKKIPKRKRKNIILDLARLAKEAKLYIRGDYGFVQVEEVIEKIINKNAHTILKDYLLNVDVLLLVPISTSSIKRAQIKEFYEHFENMIADKSFYKFNYRDTFQFTKACGDMTLTETVYLLKRKPFEVNIEIAYYLGSLYSFNWNLKSLIRIEKGKFYYSLEIIAGNIGSLLISDFTRFL